MKGFKSLWINEGFATSNPHKKAMGIFENVVY